jgi:hypothetical protein
MYWCSSYITINSVDEIVNEMVGHLNQLIVLINDLKSMYTNIYKNILWQGGHHLSSWKSIKIIYMYVQNLPGELFAMGILSNLFCLKW